MSVGIVQRVAVSELDRRGTVLLSPGNLAFKQGKCLGVITGVDGETVSVQVQGLASLSIAQEYKSGEIILDDGLLVGIALSNSTEGKVLVGLGVPFISRAMDGMISRPPDPWPPPPQVRQRKRKKPRKVAGDLLDNARAIRED